MFAKQFFRPIFFVLLALFVGAGALLGPVAAVSAAPAADESTELGTAYVNTGRLNVRAGPGASYTVVTQVDQGYALGLLGRNTQATWVAVRLPTGVEGWVNARYIQASLPIADLPVVSRVSPAPVDLSAAVSVDRLELRAGPGPQHGVVAVLGRGQAMTLLGRTADSSWVKVRLAGGGEGWIPAQVVVRLPGAENGVATRPFQTSAVIGNLPVLGVAAPRLSLSSTVVRPASPVYVTLEGFPANRDVAAVLTSRLVPSGFVIATGRTDANGYAQLFFRVPDMWPSGAAIVEPSLSLAVGTTDGALTLWSGLTYSAK